ncbi:hypothetical protein BDB01DRAFT_807888 [Pilobolus umbonatus]|nr:hypothetical protein BDB01DRAFT_807888 [Pilobolus umbonatus]
MLVNNNILVTLFAIATTFVKADIYRTVIHSQSDFCLFLPPQPGLSVTQNRQNGVPFCLKEGTVPNAKQFPEGFITTAHYSQSAEYVQVTGFFNRNKYQLDSKDIGGQYDNHAHGRPIGAQCEGYRYFVSLVEPHLERFCIRCCHQEEDCMTGRSSHGCLRVISGDYNRNNNMLANATEHSNTNINSVYQELDTLVDSGVEINKAITANQEILNQVNILQSQLTDATLHSVQADWYQFITQLSLKYPNISTHINQLQVLSSALTTVDQYKAYFRLLSEKIELLSVTTTSNDPTNTHTNSKADLDWLFEHRNNHENQATW